MAASTPDTVNPVSDQAEVNQVPCITTDCPWQPYFFGRGGKPDKGFDNTFHFFWGLEDVIGVFLSMWKEAGVAKTVAGLFPNDADGNAWGDAELGMPKPLAAAGYALTDPGRYQPMADDFTHQINAFKQAETEILTGVMIPPDLTTFWNQAKQQGLKPKIASIGKALLFPQTVEALGDAGHNLSTEVWWTPSHPFKSSLTGETAAEVSTAFTTSTGRPWTQPIGFAHALFELAVDVMKRAEDVTDGDAVAKAIGETKLDTLVGPIAWNNANLPPFAQKNVAKTPLVGGQWRLKSGGGYDLVVVENGQAPNIPLGGKMEALS